MINFKEALQIVKKYNRNFDYCTEHTDAFVFSKKDYMGIGGFGSPAAVLKEDGSCISFVAYITESHEKEVVREGYISDWK